ncbi:GSCOCG00012145001-RA-CDS [Cotesia congregata]|nr:GSCOCG00012145001-RA-CDS [Cotesia congregata]
MRHQSCCVVNCKNTSRKSECKFYKFPTAQWKKNQRNQWIAAVKRLNADGSQWVPKPCDCICSDHFIGGKKSEEELSPSYIPTIFPSIYKCSKVNESSALNRYKRVMNRRMKAQLPSTSNAEANVIESVEVMTENPPVVSSKVDQGCQIDFYSSSDINSQTFTCNRYVKDDLWHAETRTEIVEDTRSIKIHIGNKKFVDKECGTPKKTFVDKESQANSKHFNGFTSVTKDQEIIDLAGVSFENFDFLLTRMSTRKKYTVSKKDRLLIFLMKMKTGLTFSALGVLFSVHRTTISTIFYETLQLLASATRNLVFWPDIDAVQETMPDCFLPDYSNTRVIIDCTEFRIDIPKSVDNRVFIYSQYKKKLHG